MLDQIGVWLADRMWAQLGVVFGALAAVVIVLERLYALAKGLGSDRKAADREARARRVLKAALDEEGYALRKFKTLKNKVPEMDADAVRQILRDLGAQVYRQRVTGDEMWGYPRRQVEKSDS